MSAYIIDIEELAPMVQRFGDLAGYSEQQKLSAINTLHIENVISVNHRYSESYQVKELESWPDVAPATDAEAKSMIDRLIYQSCEHETYFSSSSYFLARDMSLAFVSGLYDSAPKYPEHGLTGFGYRCRYDNKTTFIVGAHQKESFVCTGGPLVKCAEALTVVCVGTDGNCRISETTEHLIKTDMDRAKHFHDSGWRLSVAQIEALKNKALEQQKQRDIEAQQKRDQAEKEREAFESFVVIPDGTKAAIVATMDINDCDIQTDYFNVKSGQTVLLAWSKHTRNLFPEMKKAIKNSGIEALQELSENPEYENRDGGYYGNRRYLKKGSAYSDGWRVHKIRVESVSDLPVCELVECLKAPQSQAKNVIELRPGSKANKPALEQLETSQGVTIEEHTHTKKGFQMFICICPRMSRDDYSEALDNARALGGWYSRKWGKTPGGFAFKDQESAQQFARGFAGESVPEQKKESAPGEAKPDQAKNKKAAKQLREQAEKMKATIEACFADRQTNTPKRMAQAMHKRMEGAHLERTRQALLSLADRFEANTAPAQFSAMNPRGIKKKLHSLLCCKKEPVQNGFHLYYIETDQPLYDDEATREAFALLDPPDQDQAKARDLQRKIEALQFSSIPGYFPTPDPVIDLMLDNVSLFPGCEVLEPSAGAGAILDRIKQAEPKATLQCCEVNHSLREILSAKGYEILEHDFLSLADSRKYDFVLMNPPFEKLQDLEHVKRAYELLKPGGKLVAIMAPSAFFRMDKKSEAFRSWFYGVRGLESDLPEGSFKASGTGVNAKIVVIENGADR